MNLLKKFSLFLFISIGLIACTEDESVEPLIDDLSSTETFFKAKFNGSNFNSTQTTASIVNNKLVMVASQGGNSFTIEIENILERTYNPNDVGVKIEYRPAGSGFAYIGKNPDVTSTGLINIRKIDYLNKKISATFNFTGYWSNPNEMRSSINFTNGIFNNITFESNIIPPPPSDQVFTCNFDGQTFNGNDIEAYYNNNSLYIFAKKTATNDRFIIYISNVATAVNYNPNTLDNVLLIYQPANTEYAYSGFNFNNETQVTGNILVSELDLVNNKVSGTFNFTGHWTDWNNPTSKIFSNGIFEDINLILGPPPSDDVFEFELNGEEYGDSNIYTSDIFIGSNGYYSIVGVKTDKRVGINIKTTLGVGTYPITSTGDAQGFYINTTPSFTLNASSGTLTIIEKTTNRIKGTFSFVASAQGGNGPFDITNGTFDVELP